jgi:hypothetical protein
VVGAGREDFLARLTAEFPEVFAGFRPYDERMPRALRQVLIRHHSHWQ